jgi:hypothetical protein
MIDECMGIIFCLGLECVCTHEKNDFVYSLAKPVGTIL